MILLTGSMGLRASEAGQGAGVSALREDIAPFVPNRRDALHAALVVSSAEDSPKPGGLTIPRPPKMWA